MQKRCKRDVTWDDSCKHCEYYIQYHSINFCFYYQCQRIVFLLVLWGDWSWWSMIPINQVEISVGRHGTPWDAMGRHGTPWDAEVISTSGSFVSSTFAWSRWKKAATPSEITTVTWGMFQWPLFDLWISWNILNSNVPCWCITRCRKPTRYIKSGEPIEPILHGNRAMATLSLWEARSNHTFRQFLYA